MTCCPSRRRGWISAFRGRPSLGAIHEMAGSGRGTVHHKVAACCLAGMVERVMAQFLRCVTRADHAAPGLTQMGVLPSNVIHVHASNDISTPASDGGRPAP